MKPVCVLSPGNNIMAFFHLWFYSIFVYGFYILLNIFIYIATGEIVQQAGCLIAMHAADPGLISGIPLCSLSLLGVITEHKVSTECG